MKQFILSMSILLIIVFGDCKHNPSNRNNDDATKNESLNTYGDSLNVYMQLIPYSVKMTADSLYFSYRVINDSPQNIFIYQFESLNTLLDFRPESDHPMCNIYLINEKNKLPSDEISTIGGPRRNHPGDIPYSYIKLVAGETKEFHRTEYIGRITLDKDRYKLKLKYLPPRNKFYNNFLKRFKEELSKNPELRDYEMYGYQIESDTCTNNRINE